MVVTKYALLLLAGVLAAQVQSYPRVVRRCDGVVVRMWCDRDGCNRNVEVIPEKLVRSHWWQFRRKVRVDFNQRDVNGCGTNGLKDDANNHGENDSHE